METFRKALQERGFASATVDRMARLAVLVGAGALFLGGGAAAALLAPGADALGAAATGTTATASVTTTSAPATTNVSTAPSVLAFTGHGWGHGLGLSQWGAYGYAQHGWTVDRILGHYYPGTVLGPTAVTSVRVLVAQAKTVSLTSTSVWSAVDAAGTKLALAPRTITIGPAIGVDGTELEPPVTFTAKEPLAVGGRVYRGKLTLTKDGALLDVVDTVGLEQYVKGVVPAEMPSTWPPEALQAQAVAARSYALANRAKGRPFDLYGDTRSQVYGGIAAETAAADAAVDATKGQVVLYRGRVADTLFFSTSGGRTVSALEATGIDVPYLISVPDPYDALSPYHDWGPMLLDAAVVEKQLKLTAPISDLSVTDGPSGRVKSAVVTTADDAQVTFTGNQLRNALDLRSTWFTAALLRLEPTARSMTFGGAVTLSGTVRGADSVVLETKASGRAWAAAGELSAEPDGTFSTIVKPKVTTWYRLAWGTARAGLARITVAARVAATATASPTGVQGTVRPVTPAAPVELQHRQADGTWTTSAQGVTDATSAWSFAGPLAAGTYRVRAIPGHGVAPGVSAPFAVQ
jgi:stage II sporulation protein D